jgi:hypothetical protein
MSSASGILIATTKSDISLGYFLDSDVRVVFFDDDLEKFTKEVSSRQATIVYIRDPFNTGQLSVQDITPRIERISQMHPDAYYVDRADTIDKVLIEDKWRQYESWKKWMPMTQLGGEKSSLSGQLIAKKRISARSRDILFEFEPSKLTTEWIVQEMLAIDEEFRVYVLLGKPVRQVSIRRSRRPGQTTKVTGLRQLSDTESDFVQKITAEMNWFDLVGLDIAITAGGLKLIEVNRSPQLKRYNELSCDNLVADFWKSIRNRQGVA